MKTIKIMILACFSLGLLAAGCAAELNENTSRHIMNALNARKTGFKACYENALERDRTIQGNVSLLLDIHEESGEVTSSTVEDTSITDEQMPQCVAGIAADIVLPEPPNVPVEGHYDVDFSFEMEGISVETSEAPAEAEAVKPAAGSASKPAEPAEEKPAETPAEAPAQ